MPFLPFFSATKMLWMAGAVIAVGIGVHTAYGLWKQDILEKRDLQYSNQALIEENADWKKANEDLKASQKLKDQEVAWARDYVAKKEAEFKALREAGSKEFVKCLDVPLPEGFSF